MNINKELQEYAQFAKNRDFLPLRRYFYNGLDIDPTFVSYQPSFEYCKESGFIEPHEELTPFILHESQWTEDYYDKVHGDLLKNISSDRVEHLIKVAGVVFKEKCKTIEARRRAEFEKARAAEAARAGRSKHTINNANNCNADLRYNARVANAPGNIVSNSYYCNNNNSSCNFDSRDDAYSAGVSKSTDGVDYCCNNDSQNLYKFSQINGGQIVLKYRLGESYFYHCYYTGACTLDKVCEDIDEFEKDYRVQVHSYERYPAGCYFIYRKNNGGNIPDMFLVCKRAATELFAMFLYTRM